MVAEEATLLLGATGSAVYRFESPEVATCVAAHPPAAEGRGRLPHPVHRRHHRDGPHGPDGRGRPRRRLPRPCRPTPSVDQVLEAGLRSGIAAPLATGGRLWGALTAGSTEAGAFGPAEERRLAAFAELAAIAVANAEARAELARLAETDPLTGPRQPPRLHQAAERRGRAGPPPRPPADAGDPRPRRLQGHQRHPRPPGGRPRAGRGRAPALRRPRAPASWSRASAARSSPGSCPRSMRPARMAPVERARARIAGIRVDGVARHHLLGGGLRPHRRARRRRAAAARRPGAVQRQARADATAWRPPPPDEVSGRVAIVGPVGPPVASARCPRPGSAGRAIADGTAPGGATSRRCAPAAGPPSRPGGGAGRCWSALAAGALVFGGLCGYALRDAGVQLSTTGPEQDAFLGPRATEDLVFRVSSDLPSLMETATLEYDGADVRDDAYVGDGELTYRPQELEEGTHTLSLLHRPAAGALAGRRAAGPSRLTTPAPTSRSPGPPGRPCARRRSLSRAG